MYSLSVTVGAFHEKTFVNTAAPEKTTTVPASTNITWQTRATNLANSLRRNRYPKLSPKESEVTTDTQTESFWTSLSTETQMLIAIAGAIIFCAAFAWAGQFFGI